MMLAFGASHECVLEQKMEHNTRSLWDITQNFGIRLDLLGTQNGLDFIYGVKYCALVRTNYCSRAGFVVASFMSHTH